jgi:threonine synthase
VAATDQEILQAETDLAVQEGTFACPEGAANLAALRKLKDPGWFKANEKVVLLNTSVGIKYLETVSMDVPLLRPDGEL